MKVSELIKQLKKLDQNLLVYVEYENELVLDPRLSERQMLQQCKARVIDVTHWELNAPGIGPFDLTTNGPPPTGKAKKIDTERAVVLDRDPWAETRIDT